jgi:FkbM family methyltransferase
LKFEDRMHVETVGRFGSETVVEDEFIRARQLDSFWLYLDKEDYGYQKHAVEDGFWEAWITLWMDRNVEPGSRVMDIGANHGYYSFFLASKGCEVHAIEPQPNLVELLCKSVAFNKAKVTVVQGAVSNTTGSVEMMVPTHHGMNATISNEHTHAPEGFTNIKVSSFTLDDIGGGFDFIKVDAEGAEDLIWAGSKEYRKKYPNTLWLMEWRWDRYKQPEIFAKEMLEHYHISFVDYNGNESPIDSVEHLATKQDEDWMLVLRGK